MIGFFIDGNIVGDPTVKPVGQEWTVLEFRIANNDDRKKEGEEWKTTPVFMEVKYWTKNPVPWVQKIVKGAYCSCAGKITQDNWDDKTTGEKRSKLVHTIEGCPTIRAPISCATNSAAPNDTATGNNTPVNPPF